MTDLPERGLSRLYKKEFNAWIDMRKRCYNTTTTRYKDWGGRGITVCDRWKNSFRNFLTDLGPAPGKEYSLDRIKNDLPYEPGNCRWATRKEQQRNTRKNPLVTFQGETLPLIEWAERLNLTQWILRGRLSRGWSVEKAFTTPKIPKADQGRSITHDGRTQTVKHWVKELGIRYSLVYERVSIGWSIEDALFTPPRRYDRNSPRAQRAKSNRNNGTEQTVH